MAGSLDALIFGYRYLFEDTTEMPRRSKLSFGPEFDLADDDTNGWTRVTLVDGGPSPELGAVQVWTPSLSTDVSRIKVAGEVDAPDGSAIALLPYLGISPVSIDAASFNVVATAIVTGRKAGGSDFAAWTVRRLFTRDASGSVAAGAATAAVWSDLQGTASGTPWLTPVLAWNTGTKFPKLTIQTNEAAATKWRAIVDVSIMIG